MGRKIVKEQFNGDLAKAYDTIVRGKMAEGGGIQIGGIYKVDGKDYLFDSPKQNTNGQYTSWMAYEVVYDMKEGEKHINYERTKKAMRLKSFPNNVKRENVSSDYFASGGMVGSEIEFNQYGEPRTGTIYEDYGDDTYGVQSGTSKVLVEKDDITRTLEPQMKRKFGFFEDGGGVDLYKVGDKILALINPRRGTDGSVVEVKVLQIYSSTEIKVLYESTQFIAYRESWDMSNSDHILKGDWKIDDDTYQGGGKFAYGGGVGEISEEDAKEELEKLADKQYVSLRIGNDGSINMIIQRTDRSLISSMYQPYDSYKQALRSYVRVSSRFEQGGEVEQ
jgi:hypothetical protein